MMVRSTKTPTAPATRKASGTAMASDQSNKAGLYSRIHSCTWKVTKAPSMTISPCAMLMTPMTPKVIASPIAASSSTDRRQQQHRAERDAVPDVLTEIPEHKPALDRGDGGIGGALQRRRRVR